MYGQFFVIIAMILTGYLMRKINFIKKEMNNSLNKLIVYCAYPCMLAYNIGRMKRVHMDDVDHGYSDDVVCSHHEVLCPNQKVSEPSQQCGRAVDGLSQQRLYGLPNCSFPSRFQRTSFYDGSKLRHECHVFYSYYESSP